MSSVTSRPTSLVKSVVSWARPRALPTINRTLRRGGTELVRAGHAPTWRSFNHLLGAHGLTPKTILDIGVAKGSPFLYESFPDARYHLIDPSIESRPFMQEIAGRLDAVVHEVALSDAAGTATLHIKEDEDMGASTLVLEDSFPVGRSYEVPLERLDSIVTDLARPALCKIDVQGFELSVLKGATGILDQLDVVVVEVSTMPDHPDAPECIDIINWFAEHGFALFDVVDLHRKPRNRLLGCLDLAFVPADSPVRSDRAWD